MINLGGCKINKYKYFEKGFNKLSKNKNYLYYYFISDKNSIINLKNNFHYTLYVIKTSKNKKIKIQDKFIKISNGCSLNNLKNKKVRLLYYRSLNFLNKLFIIIFVRDHQRVMY